MDWMSLRHKQMERALDRYCSDAPDYEDDDCDQDEHSCDYGSEPPEPEEYDRDAEFEAMMLERDLPDRFWEDCL